MTDTEILTLPRKPIPGWEGLYEVTECGFVISLQRPVRSKATGYRQTTLRVLKETKSKKYPRVSLCRKGKMKNSVVHRLVALAWVENPENKPFVNHKDGNTKNSHATNLEWVTGKENAKHAYHILNRGRHLLAFFKEKGKRSYSKLSDSNVLEMRARFKNGESCRKMSKEYKVWPETARDAVFGRTFSDLPLVQTRRRKIKNQ